MIQQIKPGLYVKQSGDTYRVVYPIKKKLDLPWSLQNCNWKNLLIGGSWYKFGTNLFILIMLLLVVVAYKHDTRVCQEALQNPTRYCTDILTSDLPSRPSLPNYDSYHEYHIPILARDTTTSRRYNPITT